MKELYASKKKSDLIREECVAIVFAEDTHSWAAHFFTWLCMLLPTSEHVYLLKFCLCPAIPTLPKMLSREEHSESSLLVQS